MGAAGEAGGVSTPASLLTVPPDASLAFYG